MEKISTVCYLDENTQCDNILGEVRGFKKPLYEFQLLSVSKALEIIRKRYKLVNQRNFLDITRNKLSALFTNSICIAEPYGSGKSIIVLAIISELKEFVPFYNHCNILSENGVRFTTEIYKKPKGIVNISAIIVSSGVFEQWKDKIKEFTDLSTLKVADLRDLVKFYRAYKNGSIEDYDILLIKSGTITGDFYIEGKSKNYKREYIVNIVSDIIRDYAIKLVVYDDYDVIKMNANQKTLNSLFDIFVSATNEKSPVPKEAIKYYSDIKELLIDKCKNRIISAANDNFLMTNFKLISDEKFRQKSTQLPMFKVFKCVYKNPNDKYIELIGYMNYENAQDILEALNGDAPLAAAGMLGINVEPEPMAIFEKILSDQWKNYNFACTILSQISFIESEITKLPNHEKINYSISELETIRKNIIERGKKGSITKKINKILSYNARNLPEFLDEIKAEYLSNQEKYGKAINKIKENLSEGECSICSLEFEDDNLDIVILKCCGVIICGDCLRKGCRLYIQGEGEMATIKGKCASVNCGKQIEVSKHVIFIRNGLDTKEFINYSLTKNIKEEENESQLVEENGKEEIQQEDEEENPKLKALYDIIMDRQPIDSKQINFSLPNLMKGSIDKPRDKSAPNKVVVFASYDETIDSIIEFLQRRQITYFRLKGSYKEMKKTLDKFRDYDGVSVLVINSHQVCAGIDNLQYFVTKLVYMHSMKNMGQIGGRIQRVGLAHNWEMYFLLYHNESNKIL